MCEENDIPRQDHLDTVLTRVIMFRPTLATLLGQKSGQNWGRIICKSFDPFSGSAAYAQLHQLCLHSVVFGGSDFDVRCVPCLI